MPCNASRTGVWSSKKNSPVARFVASVKAKAAAVDAAKFTKQIRHQAAVILISAHLHMRVLPCNVLRHADELHSQLFH